MSSTPKDQAAQPESAQHTRLVVKVERVSDGFTILLECGHSIHVVERSGKQIPTQMKCWSCKYGSKG
jgi:hypothetical protein